VLEPPAALPAAVRDREQRLLLAVRDAVVCEELAELLRADAALAVLDPADLRTVAFKDPGGLIQGVAKALPVLCNTSANFNGCGFFPDAESAMRWGKTRYVWFDGRLYVNQRRNIPRGDV
jgi:hypothetical protein